MTSEANTCFLKRSEGDLEEAFKYYLKRGYFGETLSPIARPATIFFDIMSRKGQGLHLLVCL